MTRVLFARGFNILHRPRQRQPVTVCLGLSSLCYRQLTLLGLAVGQHDRFNAIPLMPGHETVAFVQLLQECLHGVRRVLVYLQSDVA